MKPKKYARIVARRRMETFGENYKVALSRALEQIRRGDTGLQVSSTALLVWAVALSLGGA